MITFTTPITKEIKYSHGDYDMFLNGEYVGSERSYHSAEVELDRLAYERLDRAGGEPELALSATALDGVCTCGAVFNEYGQCEACGPELPPPAAPSDALARIRLAKIAAQTEPDEPADDHNLVTPDPAECPSTTEPQPCEDCPTYFILPSGGAAQSIILCVGEVSRVVSAQGVAEALTLASVHTR